MNRNGAPFTPPARFTETLGISVSTLRRWRRQGRMPGVVAKLLPALDGELGVIDRAFSGWRLQEGVLVSPEGWRFRPGEIRSIPFLASEIAEHRRAAHILKEPQQLELTLT